MDDFNTSPKIFLKKKFLAEVKNFLAEVKKPS
jgi:hypothetical protein